MLIYNPSNIEGLKVIEPDVHNDDRGYFFESWNKSKYETVGSDITNIWVQDNESKSSYGVLRGLHFQTGKYAQAKLVRVIVGSVFDVAVDIRKNSNTFGKWFGVELTEENHKQFYIPRGFAHGFLVTSEKAVFQYKCDNIYMKSAEGGIAWNDPDIGIIWPNISIEPILSKKDCHRITLKNYLEI